MASRRSRGNRSTTGRAAPSRTTAAHPGAARPEPSAVRPSSTHPLTRQRHEHATTTGTVVLVPDPDSPSSWTVEVNGVPSSYVDLEDATRVGFEYLEIMLAVIENMASGPLRVLHLGAAGCSLARAVDALRPGSRQVAVDPDTTLLSLVRDWFDLPRSPALRLRAGEGREVLAGQRTASTDVVVRDAFAPDVTPDHLTTLEFDAEVARVLRPGGLYLANVADRPPLSLARSEVATARAAFGAGNVALVAEPSVLRGRRYGNLVLAAVAPPAEENLEGQGTTLPPVDLDDAGLERRLRSLAAPVRILTSSGARGEGDELGRFEAGARVRNDPAPGWAPPGVTDAS